MRRLLASLFLMAATIFAVAETTFLTNTINKNFIGYAYDLETGELIYTEHHKYTSHNIHEVQYKEVIGEVFASKTVNYENNDYAPDFIQKNSRNGERIESKRDSNGILISYQENSSSSMDSNFIRSNPKLIIDAGFDKFITKNWKELVSGQEMTIDYLIPSSLDHYELNITKEDCKDNNFHCFSISSSSFFISLLSSKLMLKYEEISNESSNVSDDGNTSGERIRLISFKGRSNICDSEGNYHDVNIQYQYENSHTL